MSVVVTYQSVLTVVESLTTGVPDVAAGNASVTHNSFNKTQQLDALGQNPNATLNANFVATLSGGVLTLDLTALANCTNGATVNGNGLKVKSMKIQAPIGNANPITVKFGAANPYAFLGALWQLAFSPGDEGLFYSNANAPAVSGTVKNIDLAGTGAQTLNFVIVFG